jgi:hypothetical protein
MKFFSTPQLLAVIGSALGFYLLSHANAWLFESWTYGHGVNWVYLPSGLRLALVLMLGGAGALGVMIGSLLAGLDRPLSLEVTAAAAVLSGLAPWLARWICLKALRVGSDLAGLKATDVLTMAVIFALLSALLHQVLYVGTGLSDSLLKGTAVMALGDLLGTLLVLYGLKACLQFIEHKRPIDRT